MKAPRVSNISNTVFLLKETRGQTSTDGAARDGQPHQTCTCLGRNSYCSTQQALSTASSHDIKQPPTCTPLAGLLFMVAGASAYAIPAPDVPLQNQRQFYGFPIPYAGITEHKSLPRRRQSRAQQDRQPSRGRYPPAATIAPRSERSVNPTSTVSIGATWGRD